MKTIRNVLFASMLVFAFSCEKDSDVTGIEEPQAVEDLMRNAEIENYILEKGGEEALKLHLDRTKNKPDINAARVNSYDLCPGEVTYGTNYDGYEYYSFYAVAGSTIIIDVTRIDCGFDPRGNVYGPNGFIQYQDDNVWSGPYCGPYPCFADPQWNFVAPYTGGYTLEVYDFLSCSSAPWDYQITASGIVCDSDGDGCPDDEDPHPNSIQTPTVMIGGCDTGVPNQALGCSTMADILMDCCLYSGSRNAYVVCVYRTLQDWLRAGIINRAQQTAIYSCAVRNYYSCNNYNNGRQ